MKKQRITVLLLLLTVLFSSFALAEEALSPNMRVVHCKKYVSLREKPSSSSRRLTTVPLGAEVLAWRDGGADGPEDDFLYCEYRGKTGYILREYLEPILKSYDTGLGFSFQYNPNRLNPEPDMSESGKSILVEWIGYEGVPAYLELMLPEVFQEDPQAYLEANTDYTETLTTAFGVEVTGGTKTNEDYTLSYGFYIATGEGQTVLIVTTCPTELDEIADADFQDLLKTIQIDQ